MRVTPAERARPWRARVQLVSLVVARRGARGCRQPVRLQRRTASQRSTAGRRAQQRGAVPAGDATQFH
eukprot:5824505-Pleurochrysis_carterae.AAC.1